MIVFVVERYDDFDLGVWSTLDKAERYKESCPEGGRDIKIHECVVDDPEVEIYD
jgi:hypothetical protein